MYCTGGLKPRRSAVVHELPEKTAYGIAALVCKLAHTVLPFEALRKVENGKNGEAGQNPCAPCKTMHSREDELIFSELTQGC